MISNIQEVIDENGKIQIIFGCIKSSSQHSVRVYHCNKELQWKIRRHKQTKPIGMEGIPDRELQSQDG